MTVPYLIFRDAGMDVAIATIRGGEVPVDSVAKYFTHWDVEFWNDATAIAATKNTKSVDDVDFTSFDLISGFGGDGKHTFQQAQTENKYALMNELFSAKGICSVIAWLRT
jgi:putative intracellular protease/amidase